MSTLSDEPLPEQKAHTASADPANAPLRWKKWEFTSSPDVWVAETPLASYAICETSASYAKMMDEPEPTAPWQLVVSRYAPAPTVPVAALKMNRKQRRQQQRHPERNQDAKRLERQYEIPCPSEAQARQIASRHAATHNWDELEVLHYEAPLYWRQYVRNVHVTRVISYYAHLPNGDEYQIEANGDNWQPTFEPYEEPSGPGEARKYASYQEKKNYRTGPLLADLEDAKAACERHHATGRWD